jgi:hypothetical protein
MRYVIRLIIALLTFMVGLTANAIWSALQPSAPAVVRQASSDDSLRVMISPVEFFEWRSEKQSVANDETLPPSSYYRIKAFDIEESQTGMIDIVCRLENRGSQPVDLMILATGDLTVSPMRTEAERQQPPLLTERENIGQQVIRGLAPGEKREVNFYSFNLKWMTDKYLRQAFGPLRPRGFKVSVDVMTFDGVQTAWAGGELPLTFGR